MEKICAKTLLGGWSSDRTSYSHDLNKGYNYYNGWIYTNNKIDLTNYTKLYISSNIIGNDALAGSSYLYGWQKQKSENNLYFALGDEMINRDGIKDFSYSTNGKNMEMINIPNEWKGYIGICSCHSAGNEYYYDYQSSYMRNFSGSDRYIDIYSIVALKEDDWKTWIKQAKIDTTKYSTIENVLADSEILEKVFNNEEANDYLLRCSGTLMVEILKNDMVYNKIPSSLIEKMKNNENWEQFLKVCQRN